MFTSRAGSKQNGIDLIDFPPYSPDLSPIENVWSDLKRRVEQRHAQDLGELRRYVQDEWAATDPAYVARVVASMPRRCQMVVQNQGHKIHY
jgi:hypothetical protein